MNAPLTSLLKSLFLFVLLTFHHQTRFNLQAGKTVVLNLFQFIYAANDIFTTPLVVK